MNKKEALAKIKELEEYIESLDKPVGFKDDRVFLLSTEEYERYRNEIPAIRCWWWLRSPGDPQLRAANVGDDGSVDCGGSRVDSSGSDGLVYYSGHRISTYYAVRPALKYDGLMIRESKYSSRFIWNEVRWVVIDEENKIAISEMPIDFNKFDSNSNDYENSWIRTCLLNWSKE